VPTGAVLAIFIPSDLSYFSGAVSVPKGKQNFHRRFSGFKLDCFSSFSLMRKSFRDSSWVRKKTKGQRIPTWALDEAQANGVLVCPVGAVKNLDSFLGRVTINEIINQSYHNGAFHDVAQGYGHEIGPESEP
jgi:hypothetical protein